MSAHDIISASMYDACEFAYACFEQTSSPSPSSSSSSTAACVALVFFASSAYTNISSNVSSWNVSSGALWHDGGVHFAFPKTNPRNLITNLQQS